MTVYWRAHGFRGRVGGTRRRPSAAANQVPLQATLQDTLDRIRNLKAPPEKLIYLYLLLAQLQSFTTTRRALSLGERTVDRAIRRLLEKKYVVLDDR